mgnify:CR=1 FL=1
MSCRPSSRLTLALPKRAIAGGLLPLCLPFLLSGCLSLQDDRPIDVDVIGSQRQIAEPLRDSMPAAAKALLGATAQGLLAYDARGEIVDALAESWIVEDGGKSYIFRLKRLNWPDGKPVKAEDVVRLLRERFRANPLSLAGLKPDVLAMTDRVIEIRIDTALPTFIQLLAQPQFGILGRQGGAGPYRPVRNGSVVALAPVKADADAADPEPRDRRRLHVDRAALALVRFEAGRTDLVLGGRFQHLPLVPATGLVMKDLRVDPVIGLFGLAFTGPSDFLSSAAVRDALSSVIDRAALAEAFGLPGWQTADRPLPAPLGLDRQPSVPGWSSQTPADRLTAARGVIRRWTESNGEPPVLRVALPAGPGATRLFLRLALDLGQLGLRLDRVALDEPADLRLIDEVAPFDSALWYLSRLDCAAKVSCDPATSALLAEARKAGNEADQARLLSEAEEKTMAHAGFIPLGLPIRWALVNRRLTGFQLSPRGIHPLNRLVAVPN